MGWGRTCVEAGGDKRGEVKEKEEVKALRRKGAQGSCGAPTFQPSNMQFFFFFKTKNHRKHLNLFRTFEVSNFYPPSENIDVFI